MATPLSPLALLLGIQRAFAETKIAPVQPLDTNTQAPAATLASAYGTIVQVLFLVAGSIAVLYVIWGGISYITSGGSPDKTKAARGRIISALVGLGIVLLSYTIIQVALNLGSYFGSGKPIL